jgi:phage terminase large subunit-like protein
MSARPPKRRDPNFPLPSSPHDAIYREIAEQMRLGDLRLARVFALNDFWFFMRHVLTVGKLICKDRHSDHFGKPWYDHPSLFERAREFQADPYGYLDLEPRYHFKTSEKTQSHALWEFADDVDLRQMLITRKLSRMASPIFSQPKREMENNPLLHALFPDVFWRNPQQEAPLWRDDALTLRVTGNPNEPSLSIAGLTTGATSAHVDVRRWDDIVTEESVSSKEEIERTTAAWQNFAGTVSDETFDIYTGTHWAVNDTYRTILDMGVVKLRRRDVYKADGETPALRSREWCEKVRISMGPYRWACQMRNSPVAAGNQSFDVAWMRYDELDPEERAKKCRVYIFAETATAKKGSDYTVIWVIGLGRGVPFGTYYVLDAYRDRSGLITFGEELFKRVEKWRPEYVFVEQVGAMRDVDYMRHLMQQKGTSFRIIEIDEKTKKEDNILRLVPLFEAGRVVMPRSIIGRTEGRPVNLIESFRNDEYVEWTPSSGSTHDDMLDLLSKIAAPKIRPYLRFPDRVGVRNEAGEERRGPSLYKRAKRRRVSSGSTGWSM